MKNIKALSFTLEEFRSICDKVTEEKAWIESDSGCWFWVTSEEINDEEVNTLLEKEFKKEIPEFSIDKIFVDITEDMVIISYK